MYGYYDPDHPIVVGLAGPAGSGKTSTAEGIIKSEGAMWSDTGEVTWDHLYHAMPLYEYASIRLKTTGTDAKNRQLHMIHDLTQELLGARIGYDDMVELVYDIYAVETKYIFNVTCFTQRYRNFDTFQYHGLLRHDPPWLRI